MQKRLGLITVTLPRVGLMLSLASAVWCSKAARAQDPYDQKPIRGLIRGGGSFARSAITSGCPPFVLKVEERFEGVLADSAPLEQRCRVDTSFALPSADAARWLAVRYERFYVFPADSFSRANRHATRDTAMLITSVLYSAPPSVDRWRPEWNGAADRTMVWSITPTVGSRPDGSALASILYCFNGTGGCWQEYLRRRNGKWNEVAATFWTRLRAATANRVGKGMGVDIRTLTGSYGVYSEHDANCCPSHEVIFSLIQRGDTLLMKDVSVRVSPP